MTKQKNNIWQTSWLNNSREINDFYKRGHHKARVNQHERVFGVHEKDQLIAVVRIHPRQTYTLLRSLLVAQDARGKGAGHQLITALTNQLTVCYCLAQPGPALFYQKCGFTVLAQSGYPAGLADYLTRQQRKDASLVALCYRKSDKMQACHELVAG